MPRVYSFTYSITFTELIKYEYVYVYQKVSLFDNGIKSMTMAISKGSTGGKIIVRN